MTRHNAGWLFVDFCLVFFGDKVTTFETKSKFNSQIAMVDLPGRKILLVKPVTFMNDSGAAVRKIMDYYQLDPVKQLFLIHDDLDLEFGDYKVSRGKGPKVHNGLNSVVNSVGTADFVRLRLGIANDWLPKIKASGQSVAEAFVLDDFSQGEQEALPGIFQNALVDLNQFTL